MAKRFRYNFGNQWNEAAFDWFEESGRSAEMIDEAFKVGSAIEDEDSRYAAIRDKLVEQLAPQVEEELNDDFGAHLLQEISESIDPHDIATALIAKREHDLEQQNKKKKSKQETTSA